MQGLQGRQVHKTCNSFLCSHRMKVHDNATFRFLDENCPLFNFLDFLVIDFSTKSVNRKSARSLILASPRAENP